MNLLSRIFAVAGLLTAAHSFAASDFEGKVTLAMTGDKGRPMNLNYSMKGQMLRTDMDADGHQMSTIMDLPKMEMIMLMPEQRMYMVMPIKKAVETATEKQEDSTADIERTGKTETILGYRCEQILVKDRGVATELWVANDLGSFMGLNRNAGGGGPFGGRKNSAASAKWEEVLKGKGGFPLRVISRDAKGKETFKMEATKVEPGPLPDSLFAPPAGYEKFSMPDLGSMMNPFKKKN